MLIFVQAKPSGVPHGYNIIDQQLHSKLQNGAKACNTLGMLIQTIMQRNMR